MSTITMTPPGEDVTVLLDEDVRRADWSALLRQGVIVRLSISAWRPFARLDYEDLGLPALTPTERREMLPLLALGSKALLPTDWLKRLRRAEGIGRDALWACAFQTMGLHFVPVTAYAVWKAKNAEARAAFFTFRDELVSEWPAITDRLREDYLIAAGRAYEAAWSLMPGRVTSRSEFITNYVDRIMAQRPSPQEVASMFDWTTEMSYLGTDPAPATSTDTRLQELDRDMEREAARKREQLATEFIADVVGQLNDLIYTAASEVLTQVDTKGTIPGSSSRQLKLLAKRAPLLNFYGDADMSLLITRLKSIADLPADSRDVAAIAPVLRAVATIARYNLREVGRITDAPGRKLGIPGEPSLAEQRAARATLSMPAAEQLALPQVRGRRANQAEDAIEAPSLTRRPRQAEEKEAQTNA